MVKSLQKDPNPKMLGTHKRAGQSLHSTNPPKSGNTIFKKFAI
jgi:hypothetical protein